MAGLIQEQMGQAPTAPPGAEVEANPDTDPAFAQAMQLAMSALYDNGAAKEVAKGLKASGNIKDALADTAYEMVTVVDERTEGAVPDELLALLATNILQEVADIGEAAGIEMTTADVSGALKTMILRFVGEQGMDTTQLQAEMDKVDPAEFERVADEAEGVPA